MPSQQPDGQLHKTPQHRNTNINNNSSTSCLMAFMVVMAVVITTIILVVVIIMCIYVFIYLQIQRILTQLPSHHIDKKEQASWKANKEKTVNRLTQRELASLA